MVSFLTEAQFEVIAMHEDPLNSEPHDPGWKEFVPAFFRDRLFELASIQEGDDPNNPERLTKIADTWASYGDFEYQNGAYDGAECCCLSAVKIWEKLIHDNPGTSGYRSKCAS